MKGACAALAGVVGCASGLAWTARDARAQDAREVVRQIQRRYDAARDYSADFRQTTEYRTLNRRIDGEGKVFFSKPARMLWRYRKPAGQFVLSDGKHLYFYQPAEHQVIKTALGAVFRSELPLSFLLGVGNLDRDFLPELVEAGEQEYRLKLSPKTPAAGVRQLHLTVDRDHHDFREVLIEDGSGNRWTFRFENVRRGELLEPSLFKLEVPQGADIVEFGS